MEKKNFGKLACPMARSLEHVGEWWTMLILRDCFYGETRFDAIQKSLGIAPNILARRLNDLVESGLLERRQYCDKPPRSEYLLTRRGRDFRPVLLALMAWGNQHFSPEGAPVLLRDQLTGADVRPVLVDAATGIAIDAARHVVVAGPGATDRVRQRMQRAAERRASACEDHAKDHAKDYATDYATAA